MERYFWTNKEVEIVRAHYPAGGAVACVPLLPRRSKGSICQQARHLGLFYGNNRPRPRKIWETSAEIDRLIVECCQRCEGKATLKKLAQRISRPYWWAKKRAVALGVSSPSLAGNKEQEWSAAELALLQDQSHKSPDVIARLFRQHGFQRSATAIVVKRKRMRFSTVDTDHFTASQLAAEFGVDIKAVTRWIEKGWLQAKRRGTERTAAQGGDQWWIKRSQVKKFVVESIGVIDIRKVNKVWFVDLLAN